MRKLILLLLFLIAATQCWGARQLDVRVLRTMSLDAEPVQVVATNDGQRIYLLTKQGDIRLFSAEGELLGSFDAGPDVTGITPQGNNRLILEMADQKQLLQIALEPVVQISTAGAATMGAEDAPVTIVVFDDFECPHCARLAPLLKEVVGSYPGEVRLVYKHFPLRMHKHAEAAAVASLAALRQGKFWELHDQLFANYKHLNADRITKLAASIGLDMEQFERDRKDPQLQQQIVADRQEGQRNGVRGTPSVFINGRRLQQRSKAGFDEMIRDALEEERVKR